MPGTKIPQWRQPIDLSAALCFGRANLIDRSIHHGIDDRVVMKLVDPSVLHGHPLKVGSNNLPSLIGLSNPEEDVLLVAGLLEALGGASKLGPRGTAVKRQRRDFDELKEEHCSHFDRACCMSCDSSMKLHGMLHDALESQSTRGPNGAIDTAD